MAEVEMVVPLGIRDVPRFSGRSSEPVGWDSHLVRDGRRAAGAATAPTVNIFSMVAHDIRTPLTALAMSAELLAQDSDVLDRSQIRGMATAIHRRSVWLHSLLENMLCSETIAQGRLRVRPRPLSLAEVVEEIRPLVEPLLKGRNQCLRLHPAHDVPAVWGDGRRIGQVLVNLVANASKFSGPGTAIDIAIRAQGATVRLSVSDRGPGIPPGQAQRLFDPFYRAASAESSVEGVGLGLAIVRTIIDAHGGRVSARNRRGGGARFWFELPSCRSADSDVLEGAMLDASKHFNGDEA